MIRTSGKKCFFEIWGWDLRPKNVGKSQGSVKKHCLGENDSFRTVFGSVDGHIVRKQETMF